MDLTTFLTSLRGWTNFQDTSVFSDSLLTSFLRLGEEDISRDMRCSDMLQIDTATVIHPRVQLPPDFRSPDFVRIVDGEELLYKPRGQFYGMANSKGYFTTSGLYLMVGGAPTAYNEKEVEFHYFGDVPPLTGDANWVSTRYLSVLTSAAMKWASAKMEDPEQKMEWENSYTNAVSKVNDEFKVSIGAGSRLSRRIGSFG